MNDMSTIDEIAELAVFRGIARADLRSLMSLASTVDFPEGSVILREGDPADTALLVLSGRLRASVRAGHQVRKLGTVRPGEVIGEQALFVGRATRSATVTAQGPSRCMIVTRELLKDSATHPGVVAIEKHLLRVMSRRIRRTNQTIREVWHEAQRERRQSSKGRGRSLSERLRGLFREPM